MRLRDLNPEWLRVDSERAFTKVGTIAEADGIFFLCPKCYQEIGGEVGCHGVMCWRPHVPQSIHPNPGRWELEGTSFDDLSLVAGSSSVLLLGGCRAHFFVRNGEIAFA